MIGTRRETSVFILALVIAFAFDAELFALQQGADESADFFEMSLEELMNVEIAVASKTKEKLFETPAAVYVLTAEDIRRSGATNIPDALRAVPGVEVVRINSYTYSVTIRGFMEDYANKLLVMIDGRSIYTPVYSGIWWNIHDLMLEHIERIEVVRGPGGTLWGANAVNGVINIITKKTSDTQGTLITAGGGTEERGIGAAHYGGKLGENTHYRIYSKYSNHDDGPAIDGTEGADEWDIFRTGMRIDWDRTEKDKLSLQGNIFKTQFGDIFPIFSLTPPYVQNIADKTSIKGTDILSCWEHTFSETSDMALQIYYDQTERIGALFGEKRDTFDIDFQHRFGLGNRHELIWGLGYCLSTDNFSNSTAFSMTPSSRNLNLYSGFVQDQISLIRDKLKLTLGVKLEHNEYTGLEYQPSARIAWTPNTRNTVWAAVSRAVRTPSRYERDVRNEWAVYPGTPPTYMVAFGSNDVDSEELLSFELGYRFKPSSRFLLDVAAYANTYHNLRSSEGGIPQFQPTPVPHMFLPVTFDNKFDAEAYGAEVSATWKVTYNWKLSGSYNLQKTFAHKVRSSTDFLTEDIYEGKSPRNQFYFRSCFDLPGNKELDMSLKYVDSLPGAGVRSYMRFDVRFAWHINENTELNLVAQNLLDNKHAEYTSWICQNTEAERAFFANLIWRH